MTSLVVLREGGPGQPLFCFHALPGTLVRFYGLVRFMAPGRPIFGLQARGLDPAVEPHRGLGEMARDYLAEMRSVQGHGPYALYGYSMGGLVSYEIAQQLVAEGETVSLLALGDCDPWTDLTSARAYVWPILIRDILHLNEEPEKYLRMTVHERVECLVRMAIDTGKFPVETDVTVLMRMLEMYDINADVVAAYKVRPYPGKVILLRSDQPSDLGDTLSWPDYVDELIVHRVPGTHHGMMDPENASCIAQVLDQYLLSSVMEGLGGAIDSGNRVDGSGEPGPNADRDVSREAMGGGTRR